MLFGGVPFDEAKGMIMKKILVLAMVVACALAGEVLAKCIYCGSAYYGNCSNAPGEKHVHSESGKCVYCGSSYYGNCSNSPHKKHEVPLDGKCRYCGSAYYGNCSNSPNGKHAR